VAQFFSNLEKDNKSIIFPDIFYNKKINIRNFIFLVLFSNRTDRWGEQKFLLSISIKKGDSP
jgi:hypothetical protein